MNLTKVAQKFKRYSPLVLIFSVAGFLIIFTLITRSTPKKQAVIQSTLPEFSYSTQPASYDLSRLKPINVPKELGVYKLEISPLSVQQVFEVAQGLKFQNQPSQIIENTSQGTLYLWLEGESRSLSISAISGHYDVALPKNGTAAAIDLEQAKEAAINFLAQIKINPDSVSINEKQSKFFKVQDARLIPVGSNTQADVVQFAYQTAIENIPLVGNDLELGQVTVQVDENNQVVYFQFQNLPKPSLVNHQKTKGLSAALKELGSRKAVVVEAVSKTESGVEDIKIQPNFIIQSAIINEVFLAYYYPSPVPETLQPIYVFTGEFKSRDGLVGNLTLYLPALEGQTISGNK